MTMTDSSRPPRVLVVEDNPGDVVLTEVAFSETCLANRLTILSSAEKAMESLESADQSELPDLILLDLNLPGVHGSEFLNFVKGNDELRHIPVIVLSSSKASAEIKACYAAHANGFVTKPASLAKLKDTARAIETFWFSVAELPEAC